MIACVQVRHFAAAIERQLDPALAGVPLILIAYPKQRGKVVAVSQEAESAGVVVGMPLSRARAFCPQGCFITADETHYEQALDHALAALWTFTNCVEIDETAFPQTLVAYLDLGRLKESDLRALAAQMIEALGGSLSSAITVGLARGKFPASLAATIATAGEVIYIAPGTERAFVAPYPVTLLPLSKAVSRKLRLLFIRRLEELAAISRPELVAQFGKSGRLLYWLAQGIDPRPVTPRRMPQTEAAARAFDHAFTDRTRLDVAVQYLADDLAIRLEGRVAAAHHLTLTIEFERGKPAVERLHLLQPVATAKGIADALQPLIERSGLATRRGGITRIEIALMQFVSAAPRQLELLTHRPARQQLIDLTPALIERYGARFYEVQLIGKTLLPERRFHLHQVGSA